ISQTAPAPAQCNRWDNGPFGSYSYNINTGMEALAQLGSRLVVAGDFQALTATGGQAVRIAGWDGVDVTAFGDGMNGTGGAPKAFSGSQFSSSLVAGGDFTTAGGVGASHIAIWTENILVAFPPPAWAPLGAGFNGPVYAIERFNNQIYAA